MIGGHYRKIERHVRKIPEAVHYHCFFTIAIIIITITIIYFQLFLVVGCDALSVLAHLSHPTRKEKKIVQRGTYIRDEQKYDKK